MLHYIKIGNGPKTMIAFHGFGRDASMFNGYEKAFPDYTIYSISLFYHGSEWKYQNQPLSDKIWYQTFRGFLAAHDIDNFSLLGYSIGGKVALYTYQLFHKQVESLELIAPYGIKANAWEHITQKLPFLFRQFEKVIDRPAFFFYVLEALRKYKIVNKTLLDITKKQLSSQDIRFRAFHSIRLYGTLRLNLRKIHASMKDTAIPANFYLGKYDRVLTIPALHNNLSRRLVKFSLHVLPTGHGLIAEKVSKELAKKHTAQWQHKPMYREAVEC